MTAPRIHALGDSAYLCEFPAPATLDCQRRVWTVAEAAGAWLGVIDVIPGMNNLTVVFDPRRIDPAALRQDLNDVWSAPPGEARNGPVHEIPVVYGGAAGPDLEDVARQAGLSPEEVVKRHCAAEYVVYCLGFQPGFAYLGGLDPKLAAPRRADPRIKVPAGSVAIGGEQTTIYPAVSPGGWNLIGHADIRLFDPDADPPTLLSPGDRVRFIDASART
ncbi:MAG: 5-oxoprolinase subunit PxpB [Candidatus Protistobacter heckmanni]|nr:5-oxoprolinase subunit PxpB [Candidatus Protistobacter heckmanni]